MGGADDTGTGNASMRGGAMADGACEVAGAADGGGGTASADVGVTSAQSSGHSSDLEDRFPLA